MFREMRRKKELLSKEEGWEKARALKSPALKKEGNFSAPYTNRLCNKY